MSRSLVLIVMLVALIGCRDDQDHDHPHPHPHSDDHDHPHPHPHPGEHDDHDDHHDDHEPHGAHDDHDDHDHDDHDDHGHGHGHEGASEAVTIWGESVQLFVEFPALVKGEDSAFAAHLTRLSDHFAVDAGSVTVELTGDGATERFSVDKPSVAGIFRPVVRPAQVGKRRVTLRLDSAAVAGVFDMGEFTVFSTRAEADAAAKPDAEDGGISFLLEQQWKIPFRVDRVEARRLRPSIPVLGTLVLPSDAEAVIMAPREGRVEAAGARFPAVGDEVGAGDALVSVTSAPSDDDDTAALDLAIQGAVIRVEAAQREVDRLVPLLEQGVVAQRRVDEARSELAASQAELRAARRRRGNLGATQRLGARADALTLPTPVAGTIAELYVAPGAWVSKGQPIARVVDRDRLWLDLSVPESYVGRLEQVSGVWFQLAGYNGVFDVPRTALVSVGTEVDPKTRTLPVRFRVDNVRRELFAGMTTRANLITAAPALATAVPFDAVVDDQGNDVVYVQTGGETFERRPVKLGVRDGLHIEATGVQPGDWVAVTGAYSVKLASTSTAEIGHGHAH